MQDQKDRNKRPSTFVYLGSLKNTLCVCRNIQRRLLGTLLIEVEAVINSRPLTYVEDDQDEISYTFSFSPD